MNINFHIENLLAYGLFNNLFEQSDYFFVRNKLMSLLKVENIYEGNFIFDKNQTIDNILKPILDYAFEIGIITENTTTFRDNLEAEIMGLIIARPSEIIAKFEYLKEKSGIKSSTDWYYSFSQNTNYIHSQRIAKNILWQTPTDFGKVEITINLSKPEKDPKEIALALKQKQSTYPKCILCAENEGFQGNINLPARQNHRIIPITLVNEQWYFQYSPYVYFNEHCILLSKEHRPMKIEKVTFERLLKFVEQFPHYFLGSNADLPIVGGSILSHDHFQGGRHDFPMTLAKIEKTFEPPKFPNAQICIINWPMSTIRIISEKIDEIVEIANLFLHSWKNYNNPELEIYAFTDKIPHNTITPIARFRNGKYELDLVLRNNRTTEEFPDGIFHPHKHLHHIKKENIGLIEVMGLAILPGRLIDEINLIEKHLWSNLSTSKLSSDFPQLEKHIDWIDFLRNKYPKNSNVNLKQILHDEVSFKFMEVLNNCGVFKQDQTSRQYFYKFIIQTTGIEK